MGDPAGDCGDVGALGELPIERNRRILDVPAKTRGILCGMDRGDSKSLRSDLQKERCHRHRRDKSDVRSGTNAVHDETCNRTEAGNSSEFWSEQRTTQYSRDRWCRAERGRRTGKCVIRAEDHLAIGQPSLESGYPAGASEGRRSARASATGRCSVQPWETRRVRLLKRARRRTDSDSLEQLESRALLAFSTLGFSLPDLTITGQAGPRAAWGGVLDVSALFRISVPARSPSRCRKLPTTSAPTAGSPYGSTSTADAPDTVVAVLLSHSPKSLKGAVKLGTIEAPPISQNSVEQLAASFTLPARPAGFAGGGGKFYVWFVANSSNSTLEATHGEQHQQAGGGAGDRPAAAGIAGDRAGTFPRTLSPGTRSPRRSRSRTSARPIPNLQGPVTVDLVASVTQELHPGQLDHRVVHGQQHSRRFSGTDLGNYKTFAKLIINQPQNVVTISGTAVTLPASPSKYFLGVVIDPNGTINQLSVPKNSFELIHVVGPKTKHLPPAGVVSTANTEQFPNPPSGTPIGVQ